MSDSKGKASRCNVSRRKVLQAGAGVGALSVTPVSKSTANSAEEPFLVKPYLQLGNSPHLLQHEKMVVMWHAADKQVKWRVKFRNKAAARNWVTTADPVFARVAVAGSAAQRVYRTTLTGLTPGQEFDYRVERDDSVVFRAHGRARKSKSQPMRCVVMGDCGAGSPQQKAVAVQVAATNPDFVLIPGDIVYNNGRISEYQSSFWPAYSPDKASVKSGAPLLRSVPFLGGLGQHDTGAKLDRYSDGFAYYMFWSFPLNGPIRSPRSANAFPLGGNEAQRAAVLAAAGNRYPRMANYSFDYGDTHWTVLDTWNPYINWNDPRLRKWLEDDLKSTQATWKFVSSYLPPFNSSTAYPNTQKMRVVVDILEEIGVDIVFCGYAHSYQRTRPLRFALKEKAPPVVRNPGHPLPGKFTYDKQFDGRTNLKPDGVLYITTGGGGNPGLHSPAQTNNPKSWQPFTVKYNASVNQFTDLQINGRKLHLRQVDLKGNLIDELRIGK